MAAIIWTLEQLFELHKQETASQLAAADFNSELWYRDHALKYRHGHPLVKDKYKLVYSDEGYTEEEIEEAMVIKRASVTPLEVNNRRSLFIKIATEVDGILVKVSDAQKQAFVDYMERTKITGTKIDVFSNDPDTLKLTINFFYDPLLLTAVGERIDGAANTPIQDAIRNYLSNLRFNGEFSKSELIDILQSVEGCSDREAYITDAQANFKTPEEFIEIDDIYIADSGYMDIIDANLTINFTPKTVLN